MMPDVASAMTLASKIERDLHAGGWDNNSPMLLSVLGKRTAGMVLMGAVPFPFPEFVFAREGGLMVQRLGYDMRHNRELADMVEQAAKAEDGAEFAGAAFSTEAWLSAIPEAERAGRSLADIPGSQEVRMVVLFDCAGRVTAVLRKRGEKPEVEVSNGPGDAKFTVNGRITEGLRDVVFTIAQRLPFGSADLDAIRAWDGVS